MSAATSSLHKRKVAASESTSTTSGFSDTSKPHGKSSSDDGSQVPGYCLVIVLIISVIPLFVMGLHYTKLISLHSLLSSSSTQQSGNDAVGALFAQTGLSIPHTFSQEELSQYDGSDASKPILLSILGKVYDVTASPQYYGKEGGYNWFSGRDASRSFIDGCFNEKCFDAEKGLDGLTQSQIDSIIEWRSFYDEEDKYIFVGYLDGIYDEKYEVSTKEKVESGDGTVSA